jgi:hypothetical protein
MNSFLATLYVYNSFPVARTLSHILHSMLCISISCSRITISTQDKQSEGFLPKQSNQRLQTRLASITSSSPACRSARVTALSNWPLDTSLAVVTPQNMVCSVLPGKITEHEWKQPANQTELNLWRSSGMDAMVCLSVYLGLPDSADKGNCNSSKHQHLPTFSIALDWYVRLSLPLLTYLLHGAESFLRS